MRQSLASCFTGEQTGARADRPVLGGAQGGQRVRQRTRPPLLKPASLPKACSRPVHPGRSGSFPVLLLGYALFWKLSPTLQGRLATCPGPLLLVSNSGLLLAVLRVLSELSPLRPVRSATRR